MPAKNRTSIRLRFARVLSQPYVLSASDMNDVRWRGRYAVFEVPRISAANRNVISISYGTPSVLATLGPGAEPWRYARD